jgi:hypothetical protein
MPSITLRNHSARELAIVAAYYRIKAEDQAVEDERRERQAQMARDRARPRARRMR